MPNIRDPFEELSIGNFEKPIVPPPPSGGTGNAPKPPTPKAAGTIVEGLDATEKKLAEEAEKTEKELTPLERYEAALKVINVSRDEAATIVDAILVQGYWSKELRLTPKRKVVFRSRLFRDTQRFLEHVEIVQPKNPSYYNELLYKYSLAASLEQYNDTKFRHASRDDMTDEHDKLFALRLGFIEKLADPALRLCYAKLAEFDRIVTTVMEEGAAENF